MSVIKVEGKEMSEGMRARGRRSGYSHLWAETRKNTLLSSVEGKFKSHRSLGNLCRHDSEPRTESLALTNFVATFKAFVDQGHLDP